MRHIEGRKKGRRKAHRALGGWEKAGKGGGGVEEDGRRRKRKREDGRGGEGRTGTSLCSVCHFKILLRVPILHPNSVRSSFDRVSSASNEVISSSANVGHMFEQPSAARTFSTSDMLESCVF
jgi:hypothetical protein